ncbi:MAG: pyruvate, phosphate dikinase [Eubacteriaceae bacterium]|nr:pyruvate, phosphate dikinase [Eubacteriaceae bacterium]
MAIKYVYAFEEGAIDMRALLGGKGAGLAEMTRIGLPVPEGITITTKACIDYFDSGMKISDEIKTQLFDYLGKLEEKTGKKFGGTENPLLVSVRSGAAISMPGMMDTILNLGLNDASVEALALKSDNRRFAFDSYRRFIMMFSNVALDIDSELFEEELATLREEKGVLLDSELDAEDLEKLVGIYKSIYKKKLGTDFPDDPMEQLMISVEAIFKSWNNQRAITYRKINDIPNDLGTAVNIQSMVFGNMGETSGTGVAFTRNPATGEKKLFGEYLVNAQGEDLVAGIRTPDPIEKLAEHLPEAYRQFSESSTILETHCKDLQDIEFTIEEGKLYFLQTRNGNRTALAALKVAVDMVDEGLIDKKTAILRVNPDALEQMLYPTFKHNDLESKTPIAVGLPASPGAAVGKVYFTADAAVEHTKAGENVVLVRKQTSPEDIEGMHLAKGFLTSTGGMTSHAAVVARGMGKCCIAGCEAVKVYEEDGYFTVGDQRINEGEIISLHGTTGRVYHGAIETTQPVLTGDFETIMKWADEEARMEVRANADTPNDADIALSFGARGIGLCRTEHMFFEASRIIEVRKMICADTLEQRQEALNNLLPVQKQDFVEILTAMDNMPVTIRLLDPPLHEFLPSTEEGVIEIADQLGITAEKLNVRINDLHEFNPMLGHRGCRLSVSYPEIAVMQATAIIQAGIEVKRAGKKPLVEIMVPLAGGSREYNYVAGLIKETAAAIVEESGVDLHYMVGTMIEVPRAAIVAAEIAKEAEFFSFGTNDLTQMTMGFSRDDAGKYIDEYLEKKLLDRDPFQTIDPVGVGYLVKMAVAEGRKSRSGLECGVCGEHGGDPQSIAFFEEAGLDYVSCSPFRVPIARLAAAHAFLGSQGYSSH